MDLLVNQKPKHFVSIHLSAANHRLVETLWDSCSLGALRDIMEGWIGQTGSERDLLLDSEPECPRLV